MKTKLLKKVRKQYEIWFYPADKVSKFMPNKDTFILINNNNHWDRDVAYPEYNTEKKCIDFLKDCLINKLKNRYPKLGRKRNQKNNQPRKVWP